jgi:hypothetical protein
MVFVKVPKVILNYTGTEASYTVFCDSLTKFIKWYGSNLSSNGCEWLFNEHFLVEETTRISRIQIDELLAIFLGLIRLFLLVIPISKKG